MNARKALLVASRDYTENVKTKGFWFGILFVPILIILGVAVPAFLSRTRDVRRYAVLDQSGWLLAAVEERAVGDDVRQLLLFLREQAKKGSASLKEKSDLLRGLAADVKDATDEQIDAMAADFGGNPSPGGAALTNAQRARIDLVKGDLLTWMVQLDPSQARATGARMARGRWQRIEIPAGTADPEAWLRDQLQKDPKKGGLFAYFVIGPDPVAGSEGSKYVSKNFADPELHDWFSRIASDVVEQRRFAHEGVATETARRITEPLRFSERQIAAGAETDVSATDKSRQLMPVAFVYLLWMTVFMTSSALMTNTVEEKSNRLVEVLLSSVSPLEMLTGKILGTAATGLTLVGAWVGCFLGTLMLIPAVAGGGGGMPDLAAAGRDPVFLASFVAYYLLGYLLYSAVLVAIGSVCDTMRDAQSFMSPITMLLIIPLLAMVPVAQDPNGTIAKVMSWFPPFTPFVMMNRAAGPPAWWEYLGTTALLLVTVVFAFWMSAKIFRVGILMTGKPPKLRDLLRMMRAPVGSSPQRSE